MLKKLKLFVGIIYVMVTIAWIRISTPTCATNNSSFCGTCNSASAHFDASINMMSPTLSATITSKSTSSSVKKKLPLVSRSKCSPETRVAFLKTHKTGSSTITSILNRFTDLNNLEIALPSNDIRFDWPKQFSASSVDKARLFDAQADILLNHMVMNLSELKKIMKPHFKLITILRNPIDHFYSVFYYEKFHLRYGLKNFRNPVRIFLELAKTRSSEDKYLTAKQHLLKNGMAFDFNFKSSENHAERSALIKFIDKNFNFVLITEMFDEGLVILKEKFCWRFLDIVYDPKLVNPKLKSKKVAADLRENILQWNQLDNAIYQYFKRKLQELILSKSKKKFDEKVFTFRTLNGVVNNYCRNSTLDAYAKVIRYLQEIKEEPVREFQKRPHCFCNKMLRSELQYVLYFRRKFPRYRGTDYMMEEQVINGC